MAQLSSNPVTATEIAAYVKSADDFHFELQAYQACLRRTFHTLYGGTYADPVTNKARQFDIRARASNGDRRVHLLIECKCLKQNFPLLVSRIPRVKDESYHEVVISEDRFTVKRPSAMTRRLTGENSIYVINEYVGKSLTQVGKTPKGEFQTGETEVWDKWSQAISSAHELIAQCVDAGQKESKMLVTVLLPFLVVSDGTLWVADYSRAGVLQGAPQQINEALLYVGHNHSVKAVHPGYEGELDYMISHLHIVTLTGLNSSLDRFTDDYYWQELFPSKVVTPFLLRG